MKILNSLVVVMLDFHTWTGCKKLRPEDIGAAAISLPPGTLATLGSKKICDPERLRPFTTLRRRAVRICELAGVQFIGGFAIPEERLDEVLSEIKEIEIEFEAEKHQFLLDYPHIVDAWVKKNQKWGEIIRRAIENPEYVARQIRCGHQAFSIGAARNNDGEANAGLEKTVHGLSDRLMFEVGKEAETLNGKSLAGKDVANQKTLRPLKAILEKLRGLTFIDRRVDPLILRIEQGLASFPKTGSIEGRDFTSLCGLVSQLSALKTTQMAGLTQTAQHDQNDASEDDVDISADTLASAQEPPYPSVDAQESESAPVAEAQEEELDVEGTVEAPHDTVDAETAATDDDQIDCEEDVFVDDNSDYGQEVLGEDDFVLF